MHPRLYFSFHAATRKTIVFTTDINEMHLRMVDYLKRHAKKPIRPEELTFQLLIEWFAAIMECFKRTAMSWDINLVGSVRVIPMLR